MVLSKITQMYPRNTQLFLEAFEDTTQTSYGFLLDLRPNILEELHLRTGLFPLCAS